MTMNKMKTLTYKCAAFTILMIGICMQQAHGIQATNINITLAPPSYNNRFQTKPCIVQPEQTAYFTVRINDGPRWRLISSSCLPLEYTSPYFVWQGGGSWRDYSFQALNTHWQTATATATVECEWEPFGTGGGTGEVSNLEGRAVGIANALFGSFQVDVEPAVEETGGELITASALALFNMDGEDKQLEVDDTDWSVSGNAEFFGLYNNVHSVDIYDMTPEKVEITADKSGQTPAKKDGWFVEIEKMQYRLAGNWIDVPDETIYVCAGTNVFEFKVLRNPHNAPYWPTNRPTWTGAYAGTNGMASNTFTQPGTNYVTAKCGNTVTAKVCIIKVEITEPTENPVTDNNFTFNPAATPGVCNVNATGTSGVQSENPNLEWTLEAITGSTQTSNPDPPKGPNVTFTYTTLPAMNEQFGKKKLTLKHPQLPDACKDEQIVEIFFDGNDNAVNHPGAGAGTTPNWFFYWLQTSAGSGAPQYNPNQAYGSITWDNNAWVAVLGHANNGDYTPPAGGDNGGNLLNGIDHFAWVCRHEGRHVQTSTAWYPNGYNGAIDQDQDWMPDAQEPTLGGTQQNPINGGPFDPTKLDTDGDGMRDDEDYTIATQQAWTEGAADNEDWANPGHQSNN